MSSVRFRGPAHLLLERAQLVLLLAVLLPTLLLTPVGIVLLARGHGSIGVVTGVLVLAFCTTAVAGYILGNIFVRRGASLTKVQNDFLSQVSHELRTPMTSIRMFIETLRDDRISDPAERATCLGVLHREMARLDALVAKLMELSRIESGREPFENAPLSIDTVVADALAAFEAVKLGMSVSLDVALEPALEVVGDRAALARAVSNLLTNALKYTGTEKRIRLRAVAAGRNKVAITVTDNGPGIPGGEQKRIFEKFERGRAAIDAGTTGSGLGLAIVRAIVRAHRGTVELDPDCRDGSSFRILLPRRVGT
jgi:two-component system phosphate regulon sensor histidine kinase PhoR